MITGKRADLHVRTTTSVGKLEPEDVVRAAKEKGVAAIAIVEHDTVEGVQEATGASEMFGVEVIPAVEMIYEEGMRNAHIMGYFINYHNRQLISEIGRAQMERANRAISVIEKLQRLGLKLAYEDVLQEVGDSSIIDMTHIASYLKMTRAVSSMRDAFDRYLGPGRPAHVPIDQRPLPVLVDLIRGAGGVVALAHPKFGEAEGFIPQLVKEGLAAIEVYHPTHTPMEVKRFRTIARKYNLVKVGGTDSGSGAVGDITVPYRTVERLRKFVK
ncbi:MAG: PHP domain-containing protein [Candidatus Hadarchaeota archaeon]